MANRRRARRLALQGLSCLDVRGDDAWPLLEGFLTDSHETPPVISEARTFLQSIWNDREECDVLLAQHAKHWDLSRLALVDRNILRLAVHELREGRTPMKVVLAEAIKLAEEFSSAESCRFVNGVLDSVAKEVTQG